jgi:hypothetical protein
MHAFEDAKIEKGQTEWQIMVQIGCRCPLGTSRMRSSSGCAGSRPARRQPAGASSSAFRPRFTARKKKPGKYRGVANATLGTALLSALLRRIQNAK